MDINERVAELRAEREKPTPWYNLSFPVPILAFYGQGIIIYTLCILLNLPGALNGHLISQLGMAFLGVMAVASIWSGYRAFESARQLESSMRKIDDMRDKYMDELFAKAYPEFTSAGKPSVVPSDTPSTKTTIQ